MSIITMRSISRKLCVRLFMLCKVQTIILRILWCHLQTDLQNVQCVTKYILSSNRCRKQHPNRCIIGAAILPQTGTKWTKKRGSKLGALLWCLLMPQRKPQHRSTTTVHPVYNCSKKILENLLPIALLVHTNLFIPSRFWTTHTNFDNCCLCYIDVRKKIIQVHIYILGPEQLRWNFLQICQLSRRSGASIFGLFVIFDGNFTKIVAPPSDKKNCVVHLKEQSLLKKNAEYFVEICQ